MTTRVSLLPMGNRGFSKSLDHNGQGLVAYGVRSCIYIFDLRISPPVVLDSMVLRNSHSGKVVSVSFCKSTNHLLASVGEEGSLKIWNLETSSCISSLDVKDNCLVVEWLYADVNTVVFPELYGCVSKWNFKSGTSVRMKTGSNSMACILSSNKSSPELLAVGHSVGAISVLNVNSHALVFKLKTHSMEITSLSWSPVSSLMLLSVSMDQSARLWKLGEDKPFRTYYYPSARNKADDKKKNKLCGLCHPKNPDIIIISNVRGDLGTVTFKENEVPKFKSYNIRGSDQNYNFKSIYAMVPYCTDTDNHHIFLTIDNYKISFFDVSAEKLLLSYNFSFGNIYFLSVSTKNSNLMAICAGDGFIRLWNTSSEMSEVEMSLVYIDYRIKVMSTAWHPAEENIIAYGSDEGRVGVIDIYKKKLLYSYETHHSGTVYSLQWAPCKKLEDSEENFFLYSLGGGHMYIYKLNKPKEKPTDFDSLVTVPPNFEEDMKKYSEFYWKSDYTCLVLGNVRGFIELFDNKLNFLARLTLQIKNIESLSWHPMYTFASPNESNYSSWLAIAGNDDNIHIFDATDVIKEQSGSLLCKSTRILVGHKKRVTSVCWSPHNDGYLASASRDGTVWVWNAITVTCIAIYPCHRDLVYSVQWSFFDPDIIYSGGKDNCLRLWKISEQSKTLPTEKFKLVKFKAYKPKPKDSTAKDVNSSQKESSETENFNNVAPEQVENAAEDILITADAKKNFRENRKAKFESVPKPTKTIFPDMSSKFYSKEESLEDVIKLTDLLCDQHDSDSESTSQIHNKVTAEESLKFGFYADQFTAVKMLETRANSEIDNGNVEKATFLHLMACNVEPLLTSAAEKKQLTDFLVASAPTVSYNFWHEMCEKYAIQLMENQNYMKASMYFLFCGKLYDAIKIFLEKSKFLEALALAKARLPESDPFLHNVCYKVARQFSNNHLPLSEASCFLATKEPLQAAKVLFCTENSKNIYTSTYICSKFNFIEEAKTYGYFCMEKCLSQNDWPTFYNVIELVDSLKIYKVLVRVHEILSMYIKEIKKEGDSKLFGMTGNKLLIWEGKIYDLKLSFLAYIYEIIKNEGILSEDKLYLEEIRRTLDSMIIEKKYAEAHINIAIYVTQVIITSLLGDLCHATEYFVKIFSIVFSNAFFPNIICQLFLPLDLYWNSYEDTVVCESKIMEDTESFPFTNNFLNIYMLICNKFASLGKPELKDITIFECVSPDLNVTIQQLSILSKKTTEDSLFFYFCIFYLKKLRGQVKKGWKFKCYYNSVSYTKLPNNIVHENESTKSEAGSVEQSASSIDCVPLESKENHNSVDESSTSTSYNVSKVNEYGSTVLENIDEIKASALAMIDKIISEGNVSVLENVANNVEKNMSSMEYIPKSFEECQNDLEEKSDTIVSSDATHCNEDVCEATTLMNTDEIKSDATHCNEDVCEATTLVNTDEIKSYASSNASNINSEVNIQIVENDTNNVDQSEVNALCVEIDDDDEDDHLQCWADISLYYVVVKYFISVICKDDYTLKFYLGKYLHHLSSFIVKARDNSIESEISNQKCNGSVSNNSSSSETGDSALQESNAAAIVERDFTLKSEIVTDSIEENKSGINIVNGIVQINEVNVNNENGNVQVNEVSVSNENGNVQVNEVSVKNENSDVQVNEVSVKNKNSDVQVNEVCVNNENGEIENKLANKCVLNNDDSRKLENGEISLTTNIKDIVEESEVSSYIPNVEVNEIECTSQKDISEKILKHKNIYEQVNLLNSEGFCYPNPFDPVLAVNEICQDIYNKNPCKLVKDKFHDLAHEVNKWNAKFCTKDETPICIICHEKIST